MIRRSVLLGMHSHRSSSCPSYVDICRLRVTHRVTRRLFSISLFWLQTGLLVLGCGSADDQLREYRESLKEEKHRIDLRNNALYPIRYVAADGDSVRKELIPLIPQLRELQEISFNKFSLSLADLQIVGQSKSIKRIHLFNCDLEPRSIPALNEVPQLKQLLLVRCKLDDKIFKDLSGFHSLTQLDLGGNQITSISELSDLDLPNLRKLELGGNPIDDEGFKPIQKMKQLTSVDILDCKVTFEGCKVAAPLLGLIRPPMPNMSLEEKWQLKLAYDRERVEAVKRGEPILPVSHYPFKAFERGGFINDSIIERLEREFGTVPGIEEANKNGVKRPIPKIDLGY
jgi:hypothetical protein